MVADEVELKKLMHFYSGHVTFFYVTCYMVFQVNDMHTHFFFHLFNHLTSAINYLYIVHLRK